MSERSLGQPTQAEVLPENIWSLTRMFYAVGSAMVLYRLAQCYGWLSFEHLHTIPFGLSQFSFWFLADGLLFVLTMLAVGLTYRPIMDLFRWASPPSPPSPRIGPLRSIAWGVVVATAAFAFATRSFGLWRNN